MMNTLNHSKSIWILLTICIVLPLCAWISPQNSPSQKLPEEVNRQFWTADWSPDGKYIAVGGVDSLLRIYTRNLKLYRSFPMKSWIHVVKWNPKEPLLAIATLDKYVHLLDLETGKLLQLKKGGGSRAIGWNHDGKRLAVGDLDGDIQVWNTIGVLLSHIDKRYDPNQPGSAFLGLDWHPEKNIFVAVNFRVNLLDSAGHMLEMMEHPNPKAIMLCIAWHPSGSFFVIGDYGYNWEGENIPSLLHFWSPDGTLIRSVPGSIGEYRNIDWNQEGTMLATASDVLRIWDKDGVLLHASQPDGLNYLWGISWSPDGKKIVTSSRYKTISLWNKKGVAKKKLELGL